VPFRQPGRIDGNEQSTKDLRNGMTRADAGLRGSAPDDLEMAEDD
jgi:hypothetical protein